MLNSNFINTFYDCSSTCHSGGGKAMKIRYSALLKGMPPVDFTTKPSHYKPGKRQKRTSWEDEFERLETEKPDPKAEKVPVNS